MANDRHVLRVPVSEELRDLLRQVREATDARSDAAAMRAALGSMGRALNLTVPGASASVARPYPDPDNRARSASPTPKTPAFKPFPPPDQLTYGEEEGDACGYVDDGSDGPDADLD